MTTNQDRADYAKWALDAFIAIGPDQPRGTAINDLIVDLLHLARRQRPDLNPDALMAAALASFKHEEAAAARKGQWHELTDPKETRL